MSLQRLQELGFSVREVQGRVEADLPLSTVGLVNPLTRTPMATLTFTMVGDRLIVLSPPELLGVEPFRMSSIERAAELELQVLAVFNDVLSHLERRSTDLRALGLSPRVDPATLRLTTQVDAGALSFVLVADRRGNFRVLRATRAGEALELPEAQALELSDFKTLDVLAGELAQRVGEPGPAPVPAVSEPAAAAPPSLVSLYEVVERFGGGAVLPPRSALELLVEVSVNGTGYRLAAARVGARTFRALLATATAKVWSGQFELEHFPGVEAFVGALLSVPPTAVQVVGQPSVQ